MDGVQCWDGMKQQKLSEDDLCGPSIMVGMHSTFSWLTLAIVSSRSAEECQPVDLMFPGVSTKE